MKNTLDISDIEIILQSFEYSKQNIRDSQDSSYEIKQEKLSRIDEVTAKLRDIKNDLVK